MLKVRDGWLGEGRRNSRTVHMFVILWSLFIFEEERTIHLDFILRHYNNQLVLQFSNNVHKARAIFKGLKASDANFEGFMKVELCIPKMGFGRVPT